MSLETYITLQPGESPDKITDSFEAVTAALAVPNTAETAIPDRHVWTIVQRIMREEVDGPKPRITGEILKFRGIQLPEAFEMKPVGDDQPVSDYLSFLWNGDIQHGLDGDQKVFMLNSAGHYAVWENNFLNRRKVRRNYESVNPLPITLP